LIGKGYFSIVGCSVGQGVAAAARGQQQQLQWPKSVRRERFISEQKDETRHLGDRNSQEFEIRARLAVCPFSFTAKTNEK
jgi:hypothetical protein